MGTGKTACCIALMLKTKGIKAKIPSRIEVEYTRINSNPNETVCSLKEFCAAKLSILKDHHTTVLPMEIKEYIDTLGIPYFNYKRARISMRGVPLPPTKIFISHANLVVVPATLIDQWLSELYKVIYCEKF
jgi:hypothetical protein